MSKLKHDDAVLFEALATKTFIENSSPIKSGIPVNVAADNSLAEIRLYRPIGTIYSDGISGALIADEIAWLSNVVETIVIRVNSYGGTVIDGMSIIAAMQNSKAKIICIVDGIAASIASIIAICADATYIVDYGLFMTHKTHYSNGEGDSSVLEKFNESLIQIYKKRLKKTDVQVAKFMKDVDVWLNAEEAKKLGLADEIIETQAKDLVNQAREILSGLSADPVSAQIEQVANIFQNPKSVQNKKKMNEQILNALNLTAQAGEAEVLNAISTLSGQLTAKDATIAGLQADVTNKTEEISTLTGKITEFENAEKARKQKEAEDVVTAAAAVGKIKNSKEVKDGWITLYLQNPTAVKNSLDAIQVSPKLSELINKGEKADEKGAGEFKPIKIGDVMNSIDEKNKKRD